jgi:dinuclear metal center YbgI/SA1388 family protein
MVKLSDLIRFCDQYLEIDKIPDSSYNGLQVEGKEEVNKIALGVSCNEKLFQEAKKKECELILTHHGLLWNKRWQYLRGFQKKRIKFLFDNNISLATYHLPLDLHSEIGNNVLGLQRLGVKRKGGFGNYNGFNIGYWGVLESKISFDKFLERVNKIYSAKSYHVRGGKMMIETVAIVSGGARTYLEEAIDKEIDVYITGETNESVPALCIEGEMNFIAPGHYNTEKFGVWALGELLETKFDIKTEFIDIPNNL